VRVTFITPVSTPPVSSYVSAVILNHYDPVFPHQLVVTINLLGIDRINEARRGEGSPPVSGSIRRLSHLYRYQWYVATSVQWYVLGIGTLVYVVLVQRRQVMCRSYMIE
jgi:hypothetical protein